MTEAARALEAHMRSLCREAYGRDWVDHLEFALWHACINGPMRYGRLELSRGHLDRLRELSDASGGWITRRSDGMLAHLPLPEWQDLYSSNVDIVRMDEATPPPPGLEVFGE